jgi:hypothetical protein
MGRRRHVDRAELAERCTTPRRAQDRPNPAAGEVADTVLRTDLGRKERNYVSGVGVRVIELNNHVAADGGAERRGSSRSYRDLDQLPQ